MCRISDVDNLKGTGFNNKHLILSYFIIRETEASLIMHDSVTKCVLKQQLELAEWGQLRPELSHGIRRITAQWALCKYYEKHLESTCLIVGSAVHYITALLTWYSPRQTVRQPSDRRIAERMCASLHRRWKIETTRLKKTLLIRHKSRHCVTSSPHRW